MRGTQREPAAGGSHDHDDGDEQVRNPPGQALRGKGDNAPVLYSNVGHAKDGGGKRRDAQPEMRGPFVEHRLLTALGYFIGDGKGSDRM